MKQEFRDFTINAVDLLRYRTNATTVWNNHMARQDIDLDVIKDEMANNIAQNYKWSLVANKAVALTCIFGLNAVPVVGPALVLFGHWRGIEAVVKTGKYVKPEWAKKAANALDNLDIVPMSFTRFLKEPKEKTNQRTARRIVSKKLR